MKRRDFIALSGAAIVAGAVDVRAQQSPKPVIGFLRVTSAADAANLVTAFRQGLNDAGFIEGQNITVEYRWADGHPDRLPTLAADLVDRRVAVIVGHSLVVMAAKAATTTIPIVGRRRRRSGPNWDSAQYQPARRQRHRCVVFDSRCVGKAP
jgi:ABC-type uncharacterized transport system substrate-binding protein